MSKPFNIAVLLSGSGTNLQAIIDAIESGSLPNVRIVQVIADRPAGGLSRAADHGIPHLLLDRKQHNRTLNQTILDHLPAETDLLVLAGYLSIVGEPLLKPFPGKIINIHPALLPKYGGKGMYGMKVHEAVVANQEAESGCTVHFVDSGIDTGQHLFQRTVPVIVTDEAEDVQKNVLEQEHKILPKAIAYLALLHQSGLINAPLKSGAILSDFFLKKGITHYFGACHYVKNLPYHRTTERNLYCVMEEERGVCSTKHALLKALASEIGLHNVQLMFGIYKMNEDNTPGVGPVLEAAGLSYIPEAHSYLKVNNTLLDFTRAESFTADFSTVLLHEQAYQPDQIGDFKVNTHKAFLKNWIAQGNTTKSLEEIWDIREACIEALFST